MNERSVRAWDGLAESAGTTAASRLLGSFLSLVAAALALKFVMDSAYLALMQDLFSAETASGGEARVVAAYLLTVVAALAVAVDVALRPGPGNVASLLYLGIVVVPMMSLFGFAVPYADASFAVMVVVSLWVVVAVRLLVPALRLAAPGVLARAAVAAGLTLMSAYVYGTLIATGGLQRLNFDLSLVYAFREELELAQLPLAGYLIPWQANVVNMALLAYAAHRRRWLALCAVLAAQVLLFGMTNHKAFLFAPALVLGILWLARTPLRVAWGIVGGAALVVVVAWILYLATEEVTIPSIFVRRLFFVPAELHLWYYDFFSSPGNPFVTLSNSLLASVASYPYDESVPYVLGWAYAGVEIGANAGWMADAYAHFGFAGVVVFAAVLGVVLRVLDGVGSSSPLSLAAAIVAVPSMALVNSGLFTVLLTHGLLPGLLVLWLFTERERGTS